MNWKRGFSRIAFVLAVTGGCLGLLLGSCIANELDDSWSPLGLIGFSILGATLGSLLVWKLYRLLEWIVLGFCDNRPKDEQEVEEA
ncbi:MAG: hypothetical protein ACYS76_02910 [Planctomycetota bacterium]|jgi:F0F1-type ATP synthase assembly protein I